MYRNQPPPRRGPPSSRRTLSGNPTNFTTTVPFEKMATEMRLAIYNTIIPSETLIIPSHQSIHKITSTNHKSFTSKLSREEYGNELLEHLEKGLVQDICANVVDLNFKKTMQQLQSLFGEDPPPSRLVNILASEQSFHIKLVFTDDFMSTSLQHIEWLMFTSKMANKNRTIKCSYHVVHVSKAAVVQDWLHGISIWYGPSSHHVLSIEEALLRYGLANYKYNDLQLGPRPAMVPSQQYRAEEKRKLVTWIKKWDGELAYDRDLVEGRDWKASTDSEPESDQELKTLRELFANSNTKRKASLAVGKEPRKARKYARAGGMFGTLSASQAQGPPPVGSDSDSDTDMEVSAEKPPKNPVYGAPDDIEALGGDEFAHSCMTLLP
ncbi:hypothetical protein MBLNU230_g6482t1 [Neophaeotheca triangularis]